MNFLNAGIVLSTTPGLDVYQWKRSKDVQYYVHIPHMANDITSYRMFGLDYYDAIMLSGEYQVQQIRDLEKIRDLSAKDVVRQNPGGTFADRLSYYRAAASAVLYFGKGNDRKTDAGLSRI